MAVVITVEGRPSIQPSICHTNRTLIYPPHTHIGQPHPPLGHLGPGISTSGHCLSAARYWKSSLFPALYIRSLTHSITIPSVIHQTILRHPLSVWRTFLNDSGKQFQPSLVPPTEITVKNHHPSVCALGILKSFHWTDYWLEHWLTEQGFQ